MFSYEKGNSDNEEGVIETILRRIYHAGIKKNEKRTR